MAFLTQEGKIQYENVAQPETREEKGELEALVFGVTQTSQSTLLLKKRKEMREVDEALNFMKDEFKSRMESCDERQRNFELKQQEMKEQVLRFEKFVQENDAKRSRAEQKAKVEAKARVQHEERIRLLTDTLSEMQIEREKLEMDLDHLKRYQIYLDGAVEASEGEYDEIPDILNRFKTLRGANEDLTKLVEEGEREMDAIRSQLNQLRRNTQNQLLVNNSEIHANQKTLENMRAVAIKADNEREQSERITKDLQRESGQVIMSIKNLYARCIATARSKARHVSNGRHSTQHEQLAEFLKVIQYRISDLNTIDKNFESGGNLELLEQQTAQQLQQHQQQLTQYHEEENGRARR